MAAVWQGGVALRRHRSSRCDSLSGEPYASVRFDVADQFVGPAGVAAPGDDEVKIEFAVPSYVWPLYDRCREAVMHFLRGDERRARLERSRRYCSKLITGFRRS